MKYPVLGSSEFSVTANVQDGQRMLEREVEPDSFLQTALQGPFMGHEINIECCINLLGCLITKLQRLCGLGNKNLLSHSSGG